MKLMILGASLAQLIAIKKAKALGHHVITCDYLKDAVGHAYSDEQTGASTFDVQGVLREAKRFHVDGIMTLGTDQPVYTAAYAANQLNLPSMITEKTALEVTNKIKMKKIFTRYQIPTVEYLFYEKGKNEKDLYKLEYPVVIKPVDSQGQRGVHYLKHARWAVKYYDEVVSYSRENVILVEKYYEHDEVTVSGWVHNGTAYVLTITDRVTFDNKEQIGICLSHEFPSKYMNRYGEELITLTKKIVKAFQILNGPIYFQFLIGSEGIKVNEIACRIGGAFEAEFIPEITGFDICTAHIQGALGQEVKMDSLREYDILNNPNYISVQLFFATACRIFYIPSIEKILSAEGVIDAGLNYQTGDRVNPIANATSRVGYAIVKADTKEKLEKRLKNLYHILRIEDAKGKNHILHRELNP